MSDTVIRVENLGKKYVLSHQDKQSNYKSFRDVLSKGTKNLFASISPVRKADLNGHQPSKEEFWALNDVSFEIKQGERVGIIGRNGAGKSTLLKILSRITEPTKGRIQIKGRVASLLEVGTGFHPELTGRENIFLNGAILGMSKAEIKHKFDEIVAFAEIEQFLDTPVKRYSSGMYVRLAFAVAAHLEPEILIVDEVLAVGDVQFQKKCIGKMEDVGKEGRSILFVSHNLGIVQNLCSRGILLGRGTVLADDTASAVVSSYLQTLDQEASLDLADRIERKGKGQIRLTQIEVSTSKSFVSPALITGQPALFTFYVTAVKPGLSCSFTIYDQYGQAVSNFNSSAHSQEDQSDPTSNRFTCVIDELLLKPGRYRINVALMQGNELQDHVEGAAFLNVEGGQLRGRTVNSDSRYGTIALPHCWCLPT